MATPDSQAEISVTPGKNETKNNVIRFEDLVRKAGEGAGSLLGKRAVLAQDQGDRLGKVQQLAADLEKHLKALRATEPPEPDEPARP
jgi:hypothetical protein